MKPAILSTATILLIGLMSAAPSFAQSERITCLRDRNVINCPGYGSFSYNSSNNNNNNGNNGNFNRPDLDRAINAAYQEILGRNADAAGLQAYRNLMINGSSIDDVRNELANSTEARNRNGNFNRPGNNSRLEGSINDIYLQVLGRNADANGLRDYTQAINDRGWTLDRVRREVSSSPELDLAINKVYLLVLGRNADASGLQAYHRLIANGRSIGDVKNELANSAEARNRR